MRLWKATLLFCVIGALLLSGCGKKSFFQFKIPPKTAVQNKTVTITPFTFEFTGFDYKSWDIQPLMSQIMPVQTELTQKIRQVKENGSIKVFGYADRKGPENPEGDKMGNIALSLRRANAIVNYLSSRYGFSPDLFKVVGAGSSELKDSDKPYDRVNRRVVIEYSK